MIDEPVHPRVCGERGLLPRRWGDFCGSSPRVRGTGCRWHRGAEQRRFIPACAGNGHTSPTREGGYPVHPRVCGERVIKARWLGMCPGSSPRVRGTGSPAQRRPAGLRFIPACAGNGWGRVRWTFDSSVHPRVCGERVFADLGGSLPCGSSPRVRGTVRRRIRHVRSDRFIPACAGNGAYIPTTKDR